MKAHTIRVQLGGQGHLVLPPVPSAARARTRRCRTARAA